MGYGLSIHCSIYDCQFHTSLHDIVVINPFLHSSPTPPLNHIVTTHASTSVYKDWNMHVNVRECSCPSAQKLMIDVHLMAL